MCLCVCVLSSQLQQVLRCPVFQGGGGGGGDAKITHKQKQGIEETETGQGGEDGQACWNASGLRDLFS